MLSDEEYIKLGKQVEGVLDMIKNLPKGPTNNDFRVNHCSVS